MRQLSLELLRSECRQIQSVLLDKSRVETRCRHCSRSSRDLPAVMGSVQNMRGTARAAAAVTIGWGRHGGLRPGLYRENEKGLGESPPTGSCEEGTEFTRAGDRSRRASRSRVEHRPARRTRRRSDLVQALATRAKDAHGEIGVALPLSGLEAAARRVSTHDHRG